jgi:hypothetical protein
MNEPSFPWPEGCRPLETEEAVQVIMTGRHAQFNDDAPEYNIELVRALRAGAAVCALDRDNKLQIQASVQLMLDSGMIKVAGRWVDPNKPEEVNFE